MTDENQESETITNVAVPADTKDIIVPEEIESAPSEPSPPNVPMVSKTTPSISTLSATKSP